MTSVGSQCCGGKEVHLIDWKRVGLKDGNDNIMVKFIRIETLSGGHVTHLEREVENDLSVPFLNFL
jgi:hypothetical protein